jgi:L-asparagine transporter-like permease
MRTIQSEGGTRTNHAFVLPWLQIAGILILGAVLITMGIDRAWNVSWIVGVPWLVLLSAAYFAWKRRRAQKLIEGLSPG